MNVHVDALFRETLARQPDAPAILGRETLAYRQLDDRIQAAAERLAAHGVGPGATVGVHVRSGIEYIVQTYAVWRRGGCSVPIAVELTAPEKAEICRSIALDFLLSDGGPPRFAAELMAAEPASLSRRISLVPVRSPLQHPPGFRELDPAFIRFTSGSTGQSKGVVLSHRTIAERIAAANEALAIGPSDRVLWMLSMSYHFTVSIVAYLTYGAAIVLAANNFGAALVEACERHGVTVVYGAPTHCALMAEHPSGRPLPQLRLAISTTATLEPLVAARFRQRFGVPLSEALGIIEVGLPCINLSHAGSKPGSVGRPLPAYRLRLEDVGMGPDRREISFSGPGLLDAYYQPWRTRAEIAPGGWFNARDLGTVDEDGCLFVRGRSKEVISVLGMKFFPDEVERVLSAHPAVAECAVYPVPHPRSGETAHARVVLRASPETSETTSGIVVDIQRHCSRHLASYKIPEAIEIVAALPRTASGKVLRRPTDPT